MKGSEGASLDTIRAPIVIGPSARPHGLSAIAGTIGPRRGRRSLERIAVTAHGFGRRRPIRTPDACDAASRLTR
jgi:hypothetical protein